MICFIYEYLFIYLCVYYSYYSYANESEIFVFSKCKNLNIENSNGVLKQKCIILKFNCTMLFL